jgi:hypothetical protein
MDLKTVWNVKEGKWEFPTSEQEHKKDLEEYGEITDRIIVCPHCFHEDHNCDLYRIHDGEQVEINCGQCLRKFLVAVEIAVDYTSRKLS